MENNRDNSANTVLIAVIIAVIIGLAFYFGFYRGGNAPVDGPDASVNVDLPDVDVPGADGQ